MDFLKGYKRSKSIESNNVKLSLYKRQDYNHYVVVFTKGTMSEISPTYLSYQVATEEFDKIAKEFKFWE